MAKADAMPRRLTRAQLGIVRMLVEGYGPEVIARRRERSLSATYEMLGRICDRWELDHWSKIAPYARKEGLVQETCPRDEST